MDERRKQELRDFPKWWASKTEEEKAWYLRYWGLFTKK